MRGYEGEYQSDRPSCPAGHSTKSTALFDPYRPELHYMRGPGPKWRERQASRVSITVSVLKPRRGILQLLSTP